MSPELITAIIGGIGIVIGILAGIVQVVQYMQEKGLTLRSVFTRLFKRSARLERDTETSGSSTFRNPHLTADSVAYKFFTPPAGQISRAIIVMPSRPRPPLEGRLDYGNRPFKYDFAPDDVYTMATMMPYLVAVYGTEFLTGSTPFVTPEEIDTLRFRPKTIITIGSGVSNEISKRYLAETQLTYQMVGYDIHRRHEPFRIPELKDGMLVKDYGLISKRLSPTGQLIIALAGSHTFGQLAIAFALSDPSFYEHVAARTSLDQFQVVVEAIIHGGWISDYDIIDVVQC